MSGPEITLSEAVISQDERHRYSLTRRWGDGPRVCCWIMLNPSTADATTDDPTIRRCIGFTHAWGYDALTVVSELHGSPPLGTDEQLHGEFTLDAIDLVDQRELVNAQLLCSRGEGAEARGRNKSFEALSPTYTGQRRPQQFRRVGGVICGAQGGTMAGTAAST